jgi:5-dehydro-4-deoxyglucarate dehydratase
MENALIKRFPGAIGFPVTPFAENGDFDPQGFRENIEFMLDSDLAALTCCGSNGEIQALTLDEYRAVAEAAGGLIRGRKGLILGVGQTLRTAEAQARIARKAGADAVIIMAPYTADANEPGLAEYYRRVAGAAEIPVFLYQTKWSGVLPLTLLDRLVNVENICMVKDENGNLSHYLNIRVRFGDRFFWVNGMAEPFVSSYWGLGVTTFTSGLACFMAATTDEIYRLANKGDFKRINEILNETVVPLYEIRNRKPGYKVSMIKAAMDLAGLKGGSVRPPLIDLSPEDRQDLEALMTRTGLRNARRVSA